MKKNIFITEAMIREVAKKILLKELTVRLSYSWSTTGLGQYSSGNERLDRQVMGLPESEKKDFIFRNQTGSVLSDVSDFIDALAIFHNSKLVRKNQFDAVAQAAALNPTSFFDQVLFLLNVMCGLTVNSTDQEADPSVVKRYVKIMYDAMRGGYDLGAGTDDEGVKAAHDLARQKGISILEMGQINNTYKDYEEASNWAYDSITLEEAMTGEAGSEAQRDVLFWNQILKNPSYKLMSASAPISSDSVSLIEFGMNNFYQLVLEAYELKWLSGAAAVTPTNPVTPRVSPTTPNRNNTVPGRGSVNPGSTIGNVVNTYSNKKAADSITGAITNFVIPKSIMNTDGDRIIPKGLFEVLFDQQTFSNSIAAEMREGFSGFSSDQRLRFELSFKSGGAGDPILIDRPLVGTHRIVTGEKLLGLMKKNKSFKRNIKTIIADALEDASSALGTKISDIPLDLKRFRLQVNIPAGYYSLSESKSAKIRIKGKDLLKIIKNK
jgi:hypothetical protein